VKACPTTLLLLLLPAVPHHQLLIAALPQVLSLGWQVLLMPHPLLSKPLVLLLLLRVLRLA
jgi:hypothetical protein